MFSYEWFADAKSYVAWARSEVPQSRKIRMESLLEVIKAERWNIIKNEEHFANKTFDEAASEFDIFISHFDYAINLLDEFNIQSTVYKSDEVEAIKVIEPIGLVLMIIPYNFPLVVLGERLPYALAAGCSILVKGSPIKKGAVPYLVDIIKSGSYAGKKFSVEYSDADASVSDSLAKSNEVDMISFTGSTSIGRQIAISAAANFKRVSLELGGDNASYVSESSDVDLAAKKLAESFLYNQGQCCISARVIYIHESKYDLFIEKFGKESYKYLKSCKPRSLSDPLNVKKISKQITELVSTSPNVQVHFFPEEYSNASACVIQLQHSDFDDEIFGPVVRLIKSASAEEVIEYMRGSSYGLSFLLFATDQREIDFFISNIKVGRIWINEVGLSPPQLRIGGFKNSGQSWVGGSEALYDYVVFKSITLGIKNEK